MTIGQHIRLAGAVTCIIAVLLNNLLLNFLGLMIIAVGVVVHIDQLEKRVQALETKGVDDEEA